MSHTEWPSARGMVSRELRYYADDLGEVVTDKLVQQLEEAAVLADRVGSAELARSLSDWANRVSRMLATCYGPEMPGSELWIG